MKKEHQNMIYYWFSTFALVSLLLVPNEVHADTILNSKHDLSASGPGPIKAMTESEVCLFCHTPHRGTGETPLWNHALSSATYTPYDSSTLKATVGQPTGSSKLCLSCHDGTVALGMVKSRSSAINMAGGVTTMPVGSGNLGTDLSDDHPVSFTYDAGLASANGELNPPSALTGKVRLDHNNQMQCTSCHEPHDNQYGKFLVAENNGSALCITCHAIPSWQTSNHRNSNKTWNGAGVNPWPHTDKKTVAANACENCHAPHAAGTKERLLNFAQEEQNCFSCHNGNVAAKDIETEFNKLSAHPILTSSGTHDPTEDPINSARHVACVDCHNPHAANANTAIAPNASGALAGVKGVNAVGSVIKPVTTEYELCFRCHSDSVARGPARVSRQFVETNTRLEFSPGNTSFHPVETQGKNGYVPSLIAPMTAATVIYCTDCHNNDQGVRAGGAGLNGPHGSAFPPLLERQLTTTDFGMESAADYALCYKCHSRGSILADQSFPHNRHVVTDQIACTTCHDSHGVAGTEHLINFNRDYVSPNSKGVLQYTPSGTFHGNCSLTCHGKDHDNTAY